jgi:hypothetical protein
MAGRLKPALYAELCLSATLTSLGEVKGTSRASMMGRPSIECLSPIGGVVPDPVTGRIVETDEAAEELHHLVTMLDDLGSLGEIGSPEELLVAAIIGRSGTASSSGAGGGGFVSR